MDAKGSLGKRRTARRVEMRFYTRRYMKSGKSILSVRSERALGSPLNICQRLAALLSRSGMMCGATRKNLIC
jgi:hypothetical protein